MNPITERRELTSNLSLHQEPGFLETKAEAIRGSYATAGEAAHLG
jgi:hypothetical protein